ncbi:phosphotyrosine protein phosphatase [Neorhizobium sp. LMR1-1-1.1]
MKNVLFVCSQNKLRSPTAEHVFADWPGVETSSAGTNNDAENPLSRELVEWADIIFVMERAHRAKLQSRYRAALNGTRIVCLDIPDDYQFMDPRLVELLKAKVPRHL